MAQMDMIESHDMFDDKLIASYFSRYVFHQVFKVDTAMTVVSVQRFMLTNDIFARFIQINIVLDEDEERACLKLEIIGCHRQGNYCITLYVCFIEAVRNSRRVFDQLLVDLAEQMKVRGP